MKQLLWSSPPRCFAVAGPSTWNSLSDSLRDSAMGLSIFRRHLKTHFLRNYSVLEIFYENALYKFTLYLFTYLLTCTYLHKL